MPERRLGSLGGGAPRSPSWRVAKSLAASTISPELTGVGAGGGEGT